jgi:hypothetical protein
MKFAAVKSPDKNNTGGETKKIEIAKLKKIRIGACLQACRINAWLMTGFSR